MARLPLTLACWNYDRTRALADGSVVPDGIDLNYQTLPVEETFFRMLRHREFDVSEMSLSSYTISLSKAEKPFIAIPVFPSRYFRHSCIFVSTKSGIKEPKQLIGKRCAAPEYQMTAPVWIRGILSDEYGVKVTDVDHFTGGEEEPGRDEKVALNLPASIRRQSIPADKTISTMLADGELDALFTARAPSTFRTRPQDVQRLFPDYAAVERDYYQRTKIFPIMHIVAIRREVYEKNRWVAQALYKAFVEAQRPVYEDLRETAALKAMLPWLTSHVEELEATMGPNWWSYGLAPNRHVLDVFLRYHHEQGLSPKRLTPEDLFAPETLEAFKI